MISLLTLSRMQLAALLLILLYAGAAAVLLPRELHFLRGVQQPYRRLFLVQNTLLQASILFTLMPCVVAPRLNLAGVYFVLGGFLLMWATAIWAAVSRYTYTYRVLLGQKAELANRLKDIFSKVHQEEDGGA